MRLCQALSFKNGNVRTFHRICFSTMMFKFHLLKIEYIVKINSTREVSSRLANKANIKTIFGGVMYAVNNFAYEDSELSPIQSVAIFGTGLLEISYSCIVVFLKTTYCEPNVPQISTWILVVPTTTTTKIFVTLVGRVDPMTLGTCSDNGGFFKQILKCFNNGEVTPRTGKLFQERRSLLQSLLPLLQQPRKNSKK